MAVNSSPTDSPDLRPVLLAPPTDLAGRIEETELARLLGYPDRRIPAGRAADGTAAARDWYRRHGRAWALVRRIPIRGIRVDQISLAGGETLTCPVLARRLRRGAATSVDVAAVSAGPEADGRSAALWKLGRADEAYFLDRFAAAVVEHLASWTAGHLRAALEPEALGLLPSYSPGYPGWDLAQQARVAHCLAGGDVTVRELEVLDSGMIRPKSSLLAVFGITLRRDLAAAAWRRDRCAWCSLASCGFRRARPAPGG